MRALPPPFTVLWLLTLSVTMMCCLHCASGSSLVALCGQAIMVDPASGALVPGHWAARILASPQCLALLALSAAMSLQRFAASSTRSVFDVDQPRASLRAITRPTQQFYKGQGE